MSTCALDPSLSGLLAQSLTGVAWPRLQSLTFGQTKFPCLEAGTRPKLEGKSTPAPGNNDLLNMCYFALLVLKGSYLYWKYVLFLPVGLSKWKVNEVEGILTAIGLDF